MAFLVLGGLVLAYLVCAVLPGDLTPGLLAFRDYVWVTTGLVAGIACLARGARHDEERLGWALVGTGLLSYATGWLTWQVWFAASPPARFPSVADGFWLAFYPLCYAGMVLVARRRLRGAVGALWLDGLAGALVLAAAGAVVLYQPLLESTGGSSGAVITALSYALAGLHQLMFLAAVLAAAGWRRQRSWCILVGGFSAAVVADFVYAFELPQGTASHGGVIDAGWLLMMAALPVAAWQPARAPQRVNVRATGSLHVPVAFGAVALLLHVYGAIVDVPQGARVLAAAALVACAARLYGGYREMRRLERTAGRDALTGLRDHGQFHTAVEDLVHPPSPEPFALVTLDLDGFKTVNDLHGHAAGDEVLRRVAAVLAASARETDEIFRVGGDEFALLLPSATTEQAIAVASRVRDAVERLEDGLSLSFGVAEWLRDGDTKDNLLLHADSALYRSKGDRRAAGLAPARVAA